jgi:hypothetical protein
MHREAQPYLDAERNAFLVKDRSAASKALGNAAAFARQRPTDRRRSSPRSDGQGSTRHDGNGSEVEELMPRCVLPPGSSRATLVSLFNNTPRQNVRDRDLFAGLIRLQAHCTLSCTTSNHAAICGQPFGSER